MRILVLNSGSSSIKFSLFAESEGADQDAGGRELQALVDGEATGLGTTSPTLTMRDSQPGAAHGGDRPLPPGAGADAASAAIAKLFRADGANAGGDGDTPAGVDAIGYRVVHPGPRIRQHCLLTPEVLEELKAATKFAPLHQPPVLHLMEELGRELPAVPAFCCFDTVFHETMPEAARTYALPAAVRSKGVRRYGFHGISCEGVVRRLRERAEADSGAAAHPFPRRLIVAHLGSGCSVTAIAGGESLENSMGLTPDGGVVMGTRPGDLDPGVVLFLVRDTGGETVADAVAAAERTLNEGAGTAALAGMANDMKRIREAAGNGHPDAALAVRVFTRSVQKAIGAYVALLGGLDALVFTGGIGEHDTEARREILEGLDVFGLGLAPGDGESDGAVRRISAGNAAVEVLVIAAEEDRTIALHVADMMGRQDSVAKGPAS